MCKSCSWQKIKIKKLTFSVSIFSSLVMLHRKRFKDFISRVINIAYDLTFSKQYWMLVFLSYVKNQLSVVSVDLACHYMLWWHCWLVSMSCWLMLELVDFHPSPGIRVTESTSCCCMFRMSRVCKMFVNLGKQGRGLLLLWDLFGVFSPS